MTNQVCTTCGKPVIKRDDGRVLDARPSTLGIHRPDKGALTAAEFRQGHMAGEPCGHIAHHCDPVEQQALFDVFDLKTAPQRRGGR